MTAGPVGGAWCGCGTELAPLRAAWGETRCRSCAQADERAPWFIDSPPVPLEDIDDVVGYVIAVVQRRFAQLPQHDKEEYIAEGIAITYRLHQESWRREQTPSFRLYLSTYLWNRLRDYRRAQLRQSGEARRGESGPLWIGKDSLDALQEHGREPVAPEHGELAA